MLEAPEINAKLPPETHPAILSPQHKALDVDGSMGRHIITEAHTALTVVYHCLEDYQNTKAAVQAVHRTGREVVSSGRVKLEVAYPESFFTAAERAHARAARQLDSADAGIRAKMDALKTRVATALNDPVTSKPVAAEVRAHVRGLTQTKRMQFLQSAVAAGDRETVACVLGAPPYVSGLDATEMTLVRGMAEQKFAPVDSEQLQAAQKVLDKLRATGRHVTNIIGELEQLRRDPRSQAANAIKKLGQ